MELGLTIPLQRYLKMRNLSYRETVDHRFCWDLHIIFLRSRPSLLAVHCHSRYTFVLFDVDHAEWTDLSGTFLTGLHHSLKAAGVSEQMIERYLRLAETSRYTKTHGRREVAFLNRAWEDVLGMDYTLDPSAREQPLLDHAVNTKPSRCAGYDGLGMAEIRLIRTL